MAEPTPAEIGEATALAEFWSTDALHEKAVVSIAQALADAREAGVEEGLERAAEFRETEVVAFDDKGAEFRIPPGDFFNGNGQRVEPTTPPVEPSEVVERVKAALREVDEEPAFLSTTDPDDDRYYERSARAAIQATGEATRTGEALGMARCAECGGSGAVTVLDAFDLCASRAQCGTCAGTGEVPAMSALAMAQFVELWTREPITPEGVADAHEKARALVLLLEKTEAGQ